jgi:hypothetical protein
MLGEYAVGKDYARRISGEISKEMLVVSLFGIIYVLYNVVRTNVCSILERICR